MKQQTYVGNPPSNGRPLGEIFRDMVGHIAEIVRAEIRLASLEFRQDILDLSARLRAMASTMGADLSEVDIRRATEIVRRLSDETKGRSERLPRSPRTAAP